MRPEVRAPNTTERETSAVPPVFLTVRNTPDPAPTVPFATTSASTTSQSPPGEALRVVCVPPKSPVPAVVCRQPFVPGNWPETLE